MLVELHIRDFAIIDSITVPFAEGLNVLTGETGAGKSIVIDALGAVFDLRRFDPEARARIDAALAEYGLEAEDDSVILSREILLSGRSTARIGGRQLPVSVLQRVADLLVDIHGQSEHLS
ncbi:MAG: AAA family ATPase, partial [Dehalococcoidia bacterium]|nr:AAA family ATPase [Dehalococcoidia bacterium]